MADRLAELPIDRIISPVSSVASLVSSAKSLPAHAATPASLLADLETTNHALTLFLKGQFLEADICLRVQAEDRLYPSLGLGVLIAINSLFTFDETDAGEAKHYLDRAIYMGGKLKKATKEDTFYSRLSHIFNRQQTRSSPLNPAKANNDELDRKAESEIEIVARHAELVVAEAHLLRAVLLTMTDTGNTGWGIMVKEALNIRASYLTYHHAFNELATGSTPMDVHYQSGVLLGNGLFNVLFSLIPPHIARLFSLLGYTGRISIGISQLKAGAACQEGLRSRFCELFLLLFHTVMANASLVIGESGSTEDIPDWAGVVSKILRVRLAEFPKSPVYLYFLGRFNFMKKDLHAALFVFQSVITEQDIEWPQFRNAFFWELLQCNMYELEWEKCYEFARILAHESRWSEAFCTYLEAIFYQAAHIKCQPGETTACVLQSLEKVPKLQKKVGGRSIPIEKYVSKKAHEAISTKTLPFFPQYELILVWDGFSCMSPEKLEKAWEELFSALGRDLPVDKQAQLLLSLASICRALKRYSDAEQLLLDMEGLKSHIDSHSFLAPLSYLERALTYLEQGNAVQAREYYLRVVNYHGRYSMQKPILLRLSKVKIELDRMLESSS